MLQTLPTELILSIASHATRETKGTIAQTCQTCYSAIIPLLWRYLPLKAIENVDGVVNRLVRNNWLALATQFVHTIALTSDSVRHNTLEEISSLIGAIDSGYPYLLDNNPSPPLDLTLTTETKTTAKKSFGDAVRDLIHFFPQTSYLSFDYYLTLPYLLTSKAASSNDTSATTKFNGALTVSHYRPGHVQALVSLLAPFPQLSELSIQAQAALSYSDDKGIWLIGDVDLLQLAAISTDHLRHLTIEDVDEHVDLDTYRALLDSNPKMQSLTLQWRYRPTKAYLQALADLIYTMPGWHFNREGSDSNICTISLTR